MSPCRWSHVFYLFLFYPVLLALKPTSSKSPESTLLLDLNGSRTDGAPTTALRTLGPDSLTVLRVVDVPNDAGFIVVQSHSHLYDLTLSYTSPPAEKSNVNGTNLGLVYYITNTPAATSYLFNRNPFNVTVLIAVTSYSNKAPIPGGCNLEFPTKTAPYLNLTYNSAFITVGGQPSLAPENVRPPENSCAPRNLEYQMYHMYTTEMDFSETTYFEGIVSMISPETIQKTARKVSLIQGGPITTVFGAHQGTGSIFTVIVESKYGISAYVPIHTYSCNYSQNTGSCQILSSTLSKVISAIVIVIGFFLCYAGHKYFYLEMFIMGTISGGLVSYILLNLNSTTPPGYVLGATAIGLVCGGVWFLLWCVIQSPLLSVLSPLLNLGFMVASIIFFAGVSDEPIFENNFYYWTIFSSIILTSLLFLLMSPRVSNIISCTVCGGYLVILPMDYYAGGSLKYILLNVIYRASVEGFEAAKTSPPFQVPEIIGCVVWSLLAITGIINQLSSGLPPFPPPIRFCVRRSHSDATTPLLSEARFSHYSPGSDNVFHA